MQTQQTFLSKYKSLIILALDFVFMLVLIKILPFSAQENRGLALLIFIGILWLTEAFNITVTSLMVPVVAIGLGLINTQKALAPFSTPIIYMFFGGFVVAAVLQIQNLDKIIANYIIRLAKGNLKLSITYLFTATTFLSMWINNTAVAAMMLPLTMGMLKGINAEQNHRLYAFVLLGMAFSASIGGIGTLVGSAPNAILASQIPVTFTEWLGYGFPVMVLLVPSMIFSFSDNSLSFFLGLVIDLGILPFFFSTTLYPFSLNFESQLSKIPLEINPISIATERADSKLTKTLLIVCNLNSLE